MSNGFGSFRSNYSEALGAYHATLFSQEVSVNQLILEGDAQQVVIVVNSGVSQDFQI
jgi:hypothetical protein